VRASPAASISGRGKIMKAASDRNESPKPLLETRNISFADFIVGKWVAISAACEMDGRQPMVMNALDSVLRPWGQRVIGARPCYPSYVSADGFPAELSVSWRGGVPEVRVLFEPLGKLLTPFGVQESGREMVRSLAELPGVSIDPYLCLEDLFTTEAPHPSRPGVWLSLAWRPGGVPTYKVYLNPQARGTNRTWDVVAEAMDRVGLARAWRTVTAVRNRLTAAGHELEFFALDLTDGPTTRVKVYFRHHQCSVADLNRLASLARWHDPERTAWVCAEIYGSAEGRLTNEPMTCLAFRGTEEPEEANIYLRLSGNVDSDEEARRRISRIMRSERAHADQYLRIIDHMASMAPAGMSGSQELFSYRTVPGRNADIGVYFRFPAYSVLPGISAPLPRTVQGDSGRGERS
jgi:DMATS type aromatic prenyltransferase